MHAMIDLHNSSKYKVAYTFNKERQWKTPSNTGSEIQLEVQDCRTAGIPIRHCQMHPVAS